MGVSIMVQFPASIQMELDGRMEGFKGRSSTMALHFPMACINSRMQTI